MPSDQAIVTMKMPWKVLVHPTAATPLVSTYSATMP